MNNVIDVTVIIASYRPEFVKLLATINSILNQNNVGIEIIVADDGSDINYFKELKEFFDSKQFDKYVLLEHKENVGTVRNIYDALKQANGEFVKTISPGDYLYDSYTLTKWITFMRNNKCDICFGKIINYHMNSDGMVKVDKVLSMPQLISYYKNKQMHQIIQAYLILSDIPSGAAFVERTDILLKYLKMIVGKVKYAEDFSVKLMLLDGIELIYYDEDVVWYEYGTGISTSKDSMWAKRISTDLSAVNNIIINNKDQYDRFGRKFAEYLSACKRNNSDNSYLKYYYFPGLIIKNIMKKLSRNYTDENPDIEIFHSTIEQLGK